MFLRLISPIGLSRNSGRTLERSALQSGRSKVLCSDTRVALRDGAERVDLCCPGLSSSRLPDRRPPGDLAQNAVSLIAGLLEIEDAVEHDPARSATRSVLNAPGLVTFARDHQAETAEGLIPIDRVVL